MRHAYNVAVDKKYTEMITKAKANLWRSEQEATKTNPRMITSWRKPIELLDTVR